MHPVEYFFALVFLAFVTGIMECMNPIVLMVLLALVTGLMEIINAVVFVADFVDDRWDVLLRMVSLE